MIHIYDEDIYKHSDNICLSCEYDICSDCEIYNKNTDISLYITDALKKAKKELSQNGISLSTSENKIYLSSDRYKVSATVSEDGNVKWSNVEEK